MKKLLFVDCCIRRGESRTKRLAEEFLREIGARGEYEITGLTLDEENLSYLSGEFFAQRQRLLEAQELAHPRFRYAHQFAEADRVVVAAPLWDLSFPALLKVYIENLTVEGITFGCDERGCFGLCRAEKLAFLTTRGGCFEGSEDEQGSRYMAAMARFFGIPKYFCVAAEGLDLDPSKTEALLSEAIARAKELARDF